MGTEIFRILRMYVTRILKPIRHVHEIKLIQTEVILGTVRSLYSNQVWRKLLFIGKRGFLISSRILLTQEV